MLVIAVGYVEPVNGLLADGNAVGNAARRIIVFAYDRPAVELIRGGFVHGGGDGKRVQRAPVMLAVKLEHRLREIKRFEESRTLIAKVGMPGIGVPVGVLKDRLALHQQLNLLRGVGVFQFNRFGHDAVLSLGGVGDGAEGRI